MAPVEASPAVAALVASRRGSAQEGLPPGVEHARSWRREKDVDPGRYGQVEHACAGRVLRVEESYSSTGTRVWDTAVAMARLFEKRGVEAGTRVLELGAGTGLLGMALAALGASVTATDARPVVDTLRDVVSQNALPVVVDELDWRRPDLDKFANRFDFVVASDVLICEQWATALARVLVGLACPDVFVGTDRGRDGLPHFLAAVRPAFSVRQLPPSDFHPDFLSEDIIVFHLTMPP